MQDDIKYYYNEEYIFGEVNARFHQEGKLSAFDFFCIVIWKSNRAKSKIAKRLKKQSRKSLEDAVASLTTEIYQASTEKDRLQILLSKKWGFQLPMASAILTVLYPDVFTIYDVRVCDELNEFQDLKNKSNFEIIWPSYCEYREKVLACGEAGMSLRDCDRLLWGRSFKKQLLEDIQKGFKSQSDKVNK